MFTVQSTMTQMHLARGGALVANPHQARGFSTLKGAEAAARKATRDFECAPWPFVAVPYDRNERFSRV